MNTTPRLKWDGTDRLLTNYGCGRIGLENDARAFWQSRMTVAGGWVPAPELANLEALARDLRGCGSDGL